MLDPLFIRDNLEMVKAAIQNKKVQPKVDIDRLLAVYDQRKVLIGKVDDLRAEQNKLTEQIQSAADKQTLIAKATQLKSQSQTLEEELKQLDSEFQALMVQVPNVTDPRMPIGEGEEQNLVIRQHGTPPQFDFTPKDHVELGALHDIIDIDKAAEISGARFYYLKGDAVLLQFALINFVMATLSNQELLADLAQKTNNPSAKAFTPILPPVMMKPEVMQRMDRLDPIDDRYEMKQDNLILVGSAEHTIGPIHMDEVLRSEQLPIRYIGYSAAFRREAGSYGKDTKGILRVHQFDKLEMETFVAAENGAVEQDFIVAIQEYLVQQLGIPYQLVHICTGDTGKPDYNQYDIECWIPTQNKYRETHTSDYMTDFQSRRLNIKYVDAQGDKKFVHMNDATAFAIGRILIAILENFQQADGRIKIPEALVQLMGKEFIGN